MTGLIQTLVKRSVLITPLLVCWTMGLLAMTGLLLLSMQLDDRFFPDAQVYYITSTEQGVLKLLQQLFWLSMASLCGALGLLLTTGLKQHWRYILLLVLALLSLLHLNASLSLSFVHSVSFRDIAPLILLLGCLIWVVMSSGKSQLEPKCWLIAYASQTGSAMQLAKTLHQRILPHSQLCCCSQLSVDHLSDYEHVLFVVSTCGQGDAPDTAKAFMQQLQQAVLPSKPADFSVLALGDSHYPSFCAFGHRLQQLMLAKGFQQLLPLAEVDQMDMQSVNDWWLQLPFQHQANASEPVHLAYSTATLVQNQCLNPEQTSRHAHHLRLQHADLSYQPGDLLAVLPRIYPEVIEQRLSLLGWSGDAEVFYHGQAERLGTLLLKLDWTDQQAATPQALIDQLKPLHERLYSIASCTDGEVDLLVRKYRRADGSIGNASGYLCSLVPGDPVLASVRVHSGFHLSHDFPLIMIAAGTGIAPFIGFLAQRQQSGSTAGHWLFFGEQFAEHDAYFADALSDFQRQGILSQLDCVWSRESGEYVQDRLLQKQVQLREWILQRNAHIYICGSLSGFGESVVQTLQQLFDSELMKERLHTDLY